MHVSALIPPFGELAVATWEEDAQEGTDTQLSCLCPLSEA